MVQPALDLVRERSERWMASWVAQDRAALETFLADDYALVISSAPQRRFERGEWLDLAVGPYVCTRMAYRDIQFRTVSDAFVVMSAVLDCDATIHGVDRSGDFFVTDLWRRQDDEWRVFARYSAPMWADGDSIAAMTR